MRNSTSIESYSRYSLSRYERTDRLSLEKCGRMILADLLLTDELSATIDRSIDRYFIVLPNSHLAILY